MTFKSGDKVECIDNTNTGRCFTEGNIYEVQFVRLKYVYLVCDDRGKSSGGWNPERFKLQNTIKNWEDIL